MENGQEQFLHYILSSVKEEYKKEAEELLLNSFQKQTNHSFSEESLKDFNETLEGMLKPEVKNEVMSILSQFGSQHISQH